ncbi:MAG TPA: hypothetical protein VFC19_22645 [Candidatus Limnocylindrales bacterium]|nr:hypothetical protein [Candidatus Limnocylindrales bacterium]
MSLARYLLRRHRLIFGIYWGIMLLVLAALVTSLKVFGLWIVEAERASAWALAANVAPGWFVFVIGIILASVYLPVGIAHGITRRDFAIGAGLFAVATSVLFELMKIAGQLLEALAYNMFGIMEEIAEPYPWPTAGGALTEVLGYLGFMCSGWLSALIFYRMRIWWALLVAPFAAIPLSGGMEFISTETDWSHKPHWSFITLIVAGSVVAAYLAVRGLALKPKKT